MFSVELIFIVPIVLALACAIVEFAMLWSGSHKVHLAAQNACRAATRPCSDLKLLDKTIRQIAQNSLLDRRLRANHRLTFQPGQHTGDPVAVEVKVPMTAASPDMLRFFGFSLQKRYLISRVVMAKE
jgi:Flp pilus assembly protein TadG